MCFGSWEHVVCVAGVPTFLYEDTPDFDQYNFASKGSSYKVSSAWKEGKLNHLSLNDDQLAVIYYKERICIIFIRILYK